jgi:nucleoside-diphosphate-sugar epimerase
LLELTQMFGGEVEMLPPTKTTRSSQDMDTSKIAGLGWKQKHSLAEYIAQHVEQHKQNNL